jgi:hypothetical protein
MDRVLLLLLDIGMLPCAAAVRTFAKAREEARAGGQGRSIGQPLRGLTTADLAGIVAGAELEAARDAAPELVTAGD